MELNHWLAIIAIAVSILGSGGVGGLVWVAFSRKRDQLDLLIAQRNQEIDAKIDDLGNRVDSLDACIHRIEKAIMDNNKEVILFFTNSTIESNKALSALAQQVPSRSEVESNSVRDIEAAVGPLRREIDRLSGPRR